MGELNPIFIGCSPSLAGKDISYASLGSNLSSRLRTHVMQEDRIHSTKLSPVTCVPTYVNTPHTY